MHEQSVVAVPHRKNWCWWDWCASSTNSRIFGVTLQHLHINKPESVTSWRCHSYSHQDLPPSTVILHYWQTYFFHPNQKLYLHTTWLAEPLHWNWLRQVLPFRQLRHTAKCRGCWILESTPWGGEATDDGRLPFFSSQVLVMFSYDSLICT